MQFLQYKVGDNHFHLQTARRRIIGYFVFPTVGKSDQLQPLLSLLYSHAVQNKKLPQIETDGCEIYRAEAETFLGQNRETDACRRCHRKKEEDRYRKSVEIVSRGFPQASVPREAMCCFKHDPEK